MSPTISPVVRMPMRDGEGLSDAHEVFAGKPDMQQPDTDYDGVRLRRSTSKKHLADKCG